MKGGQGRHLLELYNQLYKRKDYLIFSPNKNGLKNHVTLYFLCKKFGGNILFSFLLNFGIKKLIKKHQLFIIHLHSGPGGIILLRTPIVKFIITIHHTYYQQFSYIPSQRWK